ncbi:TIGR03915 family putative DNA repair protein [Acetanaerobacterium elongatum]|uniref:Probable DNA metabolism protein n=1 Tax=Acetanaerobacterium elongatum TaxID=258515 RepID=A0A1H0F5Y1_9FIRM|nr:TIGR03915 family putative DNA repair protein [Acetanaerobacterium elongatum]SDN90067.1 probable DNA metabolism protein [Acetanaerobacterium elongatum]
MLNRADLVYEYDGSFHGLMCCVFESYVYQEIPADILSPDTEQTTLLQRRVIVTDEQKAERVLASIPKTMGGEVLDFVWRAYLTCIERKELYILLFLRLGFTHGRRVMNMLADDVVHTLTQAVRHLDREAHLLKGFIRFSITNGALLAEIDPKNSVLPVLVQHFCERYPEERFLIYDKTHAMALAYEPHRPVIFPLEALEQPEPDEEELAFRRLWQLFYDTIEVKGRHNPKCRMTHMPKRYWGNMTEFNRPSSIKQNTRAAEPEKLLLSDTLETIKGGQFHAEG